ncbi:hypothetical protein O1C43_000137 [Vibrio cholerae]|nr:hypothetical protein [Vibrio cholerae]EKF9600409.1 hypothetical protein [Vibrio cholerae]
MTVPSKDLNDKQKKYDMLHHKMRSARLKKKEEQGFKLDWLEREMLKNSLNVLSNPIMGSRSVDLNDSSYLRELDAFEVSVKIKGDKDA